MAYKNRFLPVSVPVAAGTIIAMCLSIGSASARVDADFYGLWLSDPTQPCPAGNKTDFSNLAAGGMGLYVDDTSYVSTESECEFVGRAIHSCCDTEGSKTFASAFQCGSAKGRVLLHVEAIDGKPELVEAFENKASGPNISVYRKRCAVTK